ncbi:P-loop containing nucleoside triphosphate hydrolase protein [Xylaria scruposa]|nr:P-loop containing nucleoside triphosphate hydrolase protein [Xylaria scruposa]
MDKYESIHGKDESSFDFTSTHRLPTVSAAQVFDDLKTGPPQFLRTGLEALDRTLAGVSLENDDEPQHYGGIQKGQIVEVWGPPASGKTTIAMQIASNTLQDGCRVVWVANFIHYSTPTLAHLIGLLCKPSASSVPSGTSLIVIDGLSGLINRAFPKNVEPRHRNSKGSNPALRRLQVLQYLVSALQKLSATQNLLIVVLTQCATRMQVERSATITPAINASTWEQGIATRLVLFQDWTTADAELRNIRLIGVQKNNGQTNPNSIGSIFPFEIHNGGLAGLDLETNQPSLALATNLNRQKRKFDETGIEIADSEGEDYGWEDEDEAEMPRMPPQWQGSEDLLLGRADEDDNLTAELSESEGLYEHEQTYHGSP